MIISRIVLRNYKLFEHFDSGVLPQLTLLCGENSSGKSSFISSLLALAQSFKSMPLDFLRPLMFNGHLCKMGHFQDFVHNHDAHKELGLIFYFKYTPTEQKRYADRRNAKYLGGFEHTYKLGRTGTRVKLHRVSLLILPDDIWICGKYLPSGNISFSFGESPDNDPDGIEIEHNSETISVDLTNPYDIFHNKVDKPGKIGNLINDISFNYMMPYGLRLTYTGPVRPEPARAYPLRDYYYFGEVVEQQNWVNLGLEKSADSIRIIESIKASLHNIGLPSDIRWHQVKHGYFVVEIKNPITNVYANIADMGKGISQVIPFLLDLNAPWSNIVVAEQPELHLHPSSQASLGSLLSYTIQNSEKQFIIETHSDHILNRLRKERIGNIKLSDILIIYFTQDGEVIRLGIDEQGRYENAPKSFFSTYALESHALLNARRKDD